MSGKVCTRCKTWYPIPEGFHKNANDPSGYHSHCKACVRHYNRLSVGRRREEVKEYHRQYRKDHIEAHRAGGRKYRLRVKLAVLRALGGKCACCGEARHEFLSVDHIHGGGQKHRAEVGTAGVYIDIKRRGFPKDKFRVLCMNCNFAVGHFGYCPHSR